MSEPEEIPESQPPEAESATDKPSSPAELKGENERLAEALRLRHAQLKASEEELNQTKRKSDESLSRAAKLEGELSQTQRLLQESEGQYRNLVDRLPLMIALQDVKAAKYVFWNHERNWSGHTLEEWNALSPEQRREIIHPDDLTRYVQALKKGDENGFRDPVRVEFRQKNIDGHYGWIDAVIYREYGLDGNLIAQIELSSDGTARHQVEELLQKGSEDSDVIAQFQTDFIYKTDPSGAVLYASPSFCEAFGKDPDELLGRSFNIPIHEEDWELTKSAEADLSQPPYECYYEHRALTRSGWRWIAWSKKALLNADDTATAIVGLGRDITARKRAEESVIENQNAILRLFDTLPGYVTIIKPSGEFLYVNPAMAERLGFSVGELLSGNFRQLFADSDREELERVFARLFKDGTAPCPLSLRTKSGEELPVDIVLTSGVWGDSDVVFCFSQPKPCVELAASESNKERRIAEKMEAVARLAGGVAHSLNNLLTVIGGHTQMLSGAVDPSSPAEHDLEMIKKNIQKGSTLARQLLTVAWRLKEPAEELDTTKAVSDAEPLLKRLLGDKIELSLHLPPDTERIRMNAEHFNRILLDLSDYARDAMPKGGALTIALENVDVNAEETAQWCLLAPGGYVKLTISDTGAGLADEVCNKLFEPYFNTRSGEQAVGLELAALYGLVRQSGGQIRAQSEAGKGTAFTILLPRVEEPVIHPDSDVKQLEDEHRTTILIVEDEDSVRQMAASILKHGGYRVLEARDGRDALTMSRQLAEPPDLLLADIVMPRMDGAELAGRLLQQWPRVKVLFMSGYTTGVRDTSSPDGKEAPFLQKPFRPDELLSKVEQVLKLEDKR
jgi:PAS domain S-box-containing protein